MTLTRWDPFRDLMNIQRGFTPSMNDDSYGSWSPPVDIVEKGDRLLIRAEIPGVDRDKIDIHVENNQLILSGERREQLESDVDNVYRSERRYGKFTRTFHLPKTVDAAAITATYLDGVLEVALPKSEVAKPRKIAIS